MNAVLKVTIRDKWWAHTGKRVSVLQNIALQVAAGESLAVMGPSGVGKTTLLRLIAALDGHFEGEILVDQKPLTEPDGTIQMVFQDNRLFDWMTVRQNVLFVWDRPDAGNIRKADEWLFRMGLGERVDAYPRELSEGQKKRVALTRALVRPPRVLLLDEPLAGLDTPTADRIAADLRRIQREFGFACVVTTHNVMEAVTLCQAVLVLDGHPATTHGALTLGDVAHDSNLAAQAIGTVKDILVHDR